jgi:hypothetical protein
MLRSTILECSMCRRRFKENKVKIKSLGGKART